MPNSNSPPGPYPVGQHLLPPPRCPSPETSQYRLNHLMLRIKDPEASLRFYNDCFGLHTVFIFNTGPWTIYYLGPRDVEIQTLGTSKGLLELYHIPDDKDRQYTNGNDYEYSQSVGFGHIGFTVPDVAKCLERVKSFGYRITKPLGSDEVETMAVPKSIKSDMVAEGYKHVFRQLAFVQDPDGYWVEVVPQVVH